MEWSRPTQQGEVPSPRAGHAGATVGESWFIAGGGDNKSGMFMCSLIFRLLYCSDSGEGLISRLIICCYVNFLDVLINTWKKVKLSHNWVPHINGLVGLKCN